MLVSFYQIRSPMSCCEEVCRSFLRSRRTYRRYLTSYAHTGMSLWTCSGDNREREPVKRQPELREAEFQELLREYSAGGSAVPAGVRDVLDHLSPSELRIWLEGLSREERDQFVNAGRDALAAGRRWRQTKWRAVREHPSWSNLMQLRVAHFHYKNMRKAHQDVLRWCGRKDTLESLRRLRDRLLRGR